MLFSWLKRRRRRRLLAEPFPDAWSSYLGRNVRQYACLRPDQRDRLRDLLRIFVAERTWVGCSGFVVTDEVRVTIAAQACLLLLGIECDWCFDPLRSILVYPDVMALPPAMQKHEVIVDEGLPISGQAWYRGPVILSWRHALMGGRHPHDGHNVVLHEFAHQIDALSGEMGGSPPLPTRAKQKRWDDVMASEYEGFVADVRRGRPMVLDEYAAASRAEFFAVATEHFFEQPHRVQRFCPDLYDVLQMLYRLDPAEWPACPQSAG